MHSRGYRFGSGALTDIKPQSADDFVDLMDQLEVVRKAALKDARTLLKRSYQIFMARGSSTCHVVMHAHERASFEFKSH